MNRLGCAAVLAATTALAAVTAEAELKISTVSFLRRPYFGCSDGDLGTRKSKYKKLGISGITYVGDDTYYAVDDIQSKLYKLTIKIDRKTGEIVYPSGRKDIFGTIMPDYTIDEGVKLANSGDTEGCAYDPASGNVWVAQENAALIREFDPRTGEIVRRAPVPEIMKRYYENLSLESVTISGDGKRMWTCNEEALQCDGPLSDINSGTLVRMTLYIRNSVYDNWRVFGQYKYLTDPLGVRRGGYKDLARNGVAGLCVLPDNSLLVLERCYYGGISYFHNRIYRVSSNAGAENVLSVDKLTTTNNCLHKTLLWYTDKSKPWNEEERKYYENDDYRMDPRDLKSCNFESICLGPRLNDGSCVLVLTSDSEAVEALLTLKLTGLNIHTINAKRDTQAGVQGFSQQNYRFLHGRQATIRNFGEGIAPTLYTNKNGRVYKSKWSLPKHGVFNREGSTATFCVTNDDTLVWTITEQKRAETPVYTHDTFEEYDKGTKSSGLSNWSGTGEVMEQTYTPSQGANNYILKRAEHKKVLDAEDGAVRKFNTMVLPSSKNHRIDMMVEIQRSPDSPLAAPTGSPRATIAVDKTGWLNLWHLAYTNGQVRGVWSKIGPRAFNDKEWVRVSIESYYPSDGSRAFGRVRVNGEVYSVNGGYSRQTLRTNNGKGPWFPMANKAAPVSLSLEGTKADDLIVASSDFINSLNASASIMVAPAAAGANGAAVAGGQAYTVATAVAAPVAASGAAQSEKAVAAPAIIGFGIAPDGRPHVKFKGVVDGVAYRVVRSTSVDFKPANCEYPDGSFTTEGCKDGEALWEGVEPDDPSTGAKFYRVEVVEAAAE